MYEKQNIQTPTHTFEFPADKQQQLAKAHAAQVAANAPLRRPPQAAVRPQAASPVQPAAQSIDNTPQQVAPARQVAPRSGVTMPTVMPVVNEPSAPQISNAMPGFTEPVAVVEGESLALPSRFAFYRFKDLYVKPFKGKHLAKLSRANAERSLQQMVEVVSTVLFTTTPGTGPLGFELTLPDFNFVLYWLRQNSYTKSSFIHRTTCKDEKHQADVRNGLKTEDSLQIAEIVRKGQLSVVELENIPDPEYFKFPDGAPFYLTPPTMRTACEFAASPQRFTEEREEFEFLAEAASYIQHKDYLTDAAGYWSLEKRVKALDEHGDPDEIFLIEEFKNAFSDYGVQETITVTCKGCGASRKTKVSLDAHSFLSAK